MASQNIARLGVVLGLDTAEFTAEIEKAISANGKLKNAIRRDTDAAAKELIGLKHATDDYGKSLTRVQMIQRENTSGRFMNATAEMKQRLLDQAKAYDALTAATQKAAGAQFKMNQQQQIQLTYQTTDFFTQIASGQSPLIAAIQQGGQLKDVMGGVGNAFRAIGSLITPVTVSVTALAVAFTGTAYAVYQGNEEFKKLQDTITLTGNFAGITTDKFYLMSRALKQDVNVSIGTAKDIMESLVASGRFTEQTMASVGRAIAMFAKVSGLDAKESAEKLMSGFDGTAAGAKRLNDQYNFLTIAQYKQIEALEKQNDQQAAAQIVADALTESLKGNRRQVGYLEEAWSDLKKMASSAWNAMLGLGRPEQTIEALERVNEQVIKTMKNIAERQKLGLNTQLMEAELRKQQEEFQRLTAKLVAESEAEDKKGKKARENADAIAARSKSGGLNAQIKLGQEAARLEMDAYFAKKLDMAPELQRIDIEMQQKSSLAVLEEYQKNQDTLGQFAAENARIRAAKIAAIEAEADKKRFAYRKRMSWEADLREFEQTTEVLFRIDRERTQIFRDIATKRDEQTYLREQIEAKQQLIGATKKEVDIAMARIQAEQELQRLMRTQQFKSMSEEDQRKAQKNMEDVLAAKTVNIELAESLQRTENMYNTVFSSMGSAIEQFVRTGKLSIKDFTRSVIQDMFIMQMKLQAMTLVRALIGGFSTAMTYGTNIGSQQTNMLAAQEFGMPRRANGGAVSGGTPYMVGEKGPEMFMPSGSGTIIPNHSMGMGSTTNVTNNYINAIDTKSFEDRLLGSSNAIWAANQYAGKNLATNFGRT
jgi:phage-related minor tail protein